MQSINNVQHFAIPRQLETPPALAPPVTFAQPQGIQQAPHRNDRPDSRVRARAGTTTNGRTSSIGAAGISSSADPGSAGAGNGDPENQGFADEILATTCSQINWAAVAASVGAAALAALKPLVSKYGPQLLNALKKAICKSSSDTDTTVPSVPTLNPLVPILPIGNQKSAILRPGQGTAADPIAGSDTIAYPTPYIPDNEGVPVNKRRFSGLSFRSKRWRRSLSEESSVAPGVPLPSLPSAAPLNIGVPPNVDV